MLAEGSTLGRYSTSNVRPQDRISYWHDVICKVHVPAEGRAIQQNAFEASLSAIDLGPVTLTEMKSSKQFWRRTYSHIRKTDEDVVLLSYAASGACRFEQDHKQVIQNKGEFLLYDTANPFTYELDPEVFYVLKIRRQALLARCLQAERALISPLRADVPLAMTLSTLMKEALFYTDQAGPPDFRARIGHALLDVLALIIDIKLGKEGQSGTKQDVQLHKLQQYILSNLDDPDLNIDRIAQIHHISARSVTRLFAKYGLTPMSWLREKRLEASYQALTVESKLSVTQAAFQFGFSDLSHFSRTFKQRYGIAPHEARKGSGRYQS